jgi:hypothetical protein
MSTLSRSKASGTPYWSNGAIKGYWSNTHTHTLVAYFGKLALIKLVKTFDQIKLVKTTVNGYWSSTLAKHDGQKALVNREDQEILGKQDDRKYWSN